ncbi:unnamed protein product [Diamesa hyperborea]
MAQIITARLSRNDAQPWGFRLQGGKDFGTPLVIQKVNTGSIADKAGLQAGDAVVRVNEADLYNLRHKDAQDAIVRAGTSFELIVQRGATWKPTVTPLPNISPSMGSHIQPVTKTSLAANPQQVCTIGSGHNSAARPFVNVNPNRLPPSPVRSITSKQYNSPVGMYSDQSIAESLSAQAEVLAGGVLGVNFKKNEKVYNPEKSEVLKMLQENESDPEPAGSTFYWRQSHAIGGSATSAQSHRPLTPSYQTIPDDRIGTPLQQNVLAPAALHRPSLPQQPQPILKPAIPTYSQYSPHGVFVRIKDKNLHQECFKCATCGTSLKNQGYYNLHNKLYCDIHARLAALNSPPPNATANGLVPVTLPPKNMGASTISSALNAHAGNMNGNGNGNGNNNNSCPELTKIKLNTKVNDDNNNNFYDTRSNCSTSETDCSSLSSSDKENDSRPSSSLYGSIKPESQIKNINENFQYKTLNGAVVKSVVPPGKGIKVDYYKVPNMAGPKPFSYTQAPQSMAGPPMAAPKSPSSYPPAQPAWAPTSAVNAAPKPIGQQNVQEDYDEDYYYVEDKVKEKRIEIYVPDEESEEEFDPKDLVNISRPPPSNFIWPPLCEIEKVPIAAPLYTQPPETQHVTVRPCTRPFEKPSSRLSAQNLIKVESQQTTDTMDSVTEYVCCAGMDSNNSNTCITATTTSTTSNASSESEYKMYQTQNNQYANMFDKSCKDDDHEILEINNSKITDLRVTPPPPELPKIIKHVEFVEPEASYKAETYSNVFSSRKETWQKLTGSNTKKDEKIKPIQQPVVELNDDEEDDVEAELIQGQHCGPNEGSYYQLAPSNIPQPTPKLYQSEMQKALIYSSERPYHISDVAPTPEPKIPNIDMYEAAIREAQLEELLKRDEPEEAKNRQRRETPKFEVKTTKKACDFPLANQQPRKGTLMSTMARTASPKPIEFMRTNIIEPVDLPDDSDAYFPPPVSMEPKPKMVSMESYRTKSPFVAALTTVPDRPFTPFGQEIMSQLVLELPANYLKKSTMTNALKTAPEESFDPSSMEYEYDPTEYTAKVYERINQEADADESFDNQSAFVQIGSLTRSFLPSIQPWSSHSDQPAANNYIDAMSGQTDCKVSTSCHCKHAECCQQQQQEEVVEPEKPVHQPLYPKRNSQPSPFEGLQVKVGNKMTNALHKPDDIPNYQRKWFNLPTQNPGRTPEPDELRDNVPLAFTGQTAEERSRTERLSRPSSSMYASVTNQQQTVWPPSKPPTPALVLPARQVPVIRADSESELNGSKFRFEPLDEQQRSFMAGIRPPSTCYSPPTEEKPFPSIPYYQQHLAFYEAEPEHAGIFNPKACSPVPNRSRSPAFGPPPNPMRAFVPKCRDPDLDESGIYLCGGLLLSPVWYDKQEKQLPPGVQKKNLQGASRPPSKPDFEALHRIAHERKVHNLINSRPSSPAIRTTTNDTKAAPIPPPMPPTTPQVQLRQKRSIAEDGECQQIESKDGLPPKGIVANQVRRLSSDIGGIPLFPIRPTFTVSEQAAKNHFPISQSPTTVQEILDFGLGHNTPSQDGYERQMSNLHLQQQTKISSSSSSASYHQQQQLLTTNQSHVSSQSSNHNFKNEQSLASAVSLQIPNVNPNSVVNRTSTGSVGQPGALPKHGRTFTTTGPNRGQGVLTQPTTGGRVPLCGCCASQIRGPFITALGKIWCPDHFVCVNGNCKRELADIGFVEEKGDLYCEYCFEQFLAPPCSKCNGKIKGDCLNAIGKKFHPECFKCTYCGKLFGNSPFFLEEGEAYCEADWNELFTTKCFACGFPVEAGDRWVEALNNNYHSQCFNCTYCKKNLEGQSFFAKGGRPFCKAHAR